MLSKERKGEIALAYVTNLMRKKSFNFQQDLKRSIGSERVELNKVIDSQQEISEKEITVEELFMFMEEIVRNEVDRCFTRIKEGN